MSYEKQIKLLIDVLPIALQDNRMALKGGTAINLFHRNIPRLSVDIDLSYLPIEDRVTTYKNIHSILKKVKEDVKDKLGCSVKESKKLEKTNEAKLFIEKDGITIKVEPNYIIRGNIIPPEILPLVESAQEEFEREVDVQCIAHNELYAGKICAALDRQHPRDLFDIHLLLKNEGITKELKDAFLVYLLSHGRPMKELLSPNIKEIKEVYEKELKGMERIEITLEDLEQARINLIKEINDLLDVDDKLFLISFLDLSPDWSKSKHPGMKDLPAVKWKIQNLNKVSEEKREVLKTELKKHLNI